MSLHSSCVSRLSHSQCDSLWCLWLAFSLLCIMPWCWIQCLHVCRGMSSSRSMACCLLTRSALCWKKESAQQALSCKAAMTWRWTLPSTGTYCALLCQWLLLTCKKGTATFLMAWITSETAWPVVVSQSRATCSSRTVDLLLAEGHCGVRSWLCLTVDFAGNVRRPCGRRECQYVNRCWTSDLQTLQISQRM